MIPCRRRRGITLLEVIISLVILALIIVAVYRSYVFFLDNISFYLKRSDAHMEIDYAFEHMRAHLLSAVMIDDASAFAPGRTNSRADFSFYAESNISVVTPDDDTDNALYTYEVTEQGLMMKKRDFDGTETQETLVSGYLEPNVAFTYTEDTEPNFMAVTIDAGPRRGRIQKTEGMRLWFVDVVK